MINKVLTLFFYLALKAVKGEEIAFSTNVSPVLGNISYSNEHYLEPQNIEELKQIILDAVATGKRIKPVGSLHSFNDISDTDGI